MNVRKLGWVGLLAVAVMSGFVLRGTDLRRADAADQPGDNKIVVISSNSAPPYSYFEGEAHVGFEVDFWDEIARRTGLTVQFETSGFSGLFGSLDSGRVDAVSCFMGITPQRQEKFAFSVPYAVDPLGFFVAVDSPIQSVEELEGKVVAVEDGAQGQLELNALIAQGKKYTVQRGKRPASAAGREKETFLTVGLSLRQQNRTRYEGLPIKTIQ